MQPTQVFGDMLTALAEQDDELDGLLAGLDDAGWARPSRCPDWSICDVVLHLAQTDEMALASAERRFTDVVTEFGRTPRGPVAVRLTGPGGEPWEFTPDEPAATTVTGPALDFCLVAARRVDPSATALRASGPDAAAVLELVRTFA